MVNATLPKVEPIRALYGPMPYGSPDWSFEFKYDGFRGLLYLENEKSYFVSRQNKVLHQFDELAVALAQKLKKKVRNAIFDGELITKDREGRPIFNDILHRRGTPTYVAFDLLWLNDEDFRMLPLKERKKKLKSILPKRSPLIEESFTTEGLLGQKLFDFMCEHDLEGAVAKKLSDSYTKRTKWYKIKNPTYSQAIGRKDFFNAVKKKVAR